MTPKTLYEMDGTPHEVVPVEGSASWFYATTAEVCYHAVGEGRYTQEQPGTRKVLGVVYEAPTHACTDAGWPIEAIELVMSIADEVPPGTLVENLRDRRDRACSDKWLDCLYDSVGGGNDLCKDCPLIEEAKK